MPRTISGPRTLALVAAVVLPWGCATAPHAPASSDPAVAAADYAGAPFLAFDRIVIDVPPGTPIGQRKSGKMCEVHEPLAWDQAPRDADPTRFASAFTEALAGAGYPVGDAGEGPPAAEGGLVASAVIERVRADICYPLLDYGNRRVRKGDGDVNVAWQVVSRGRREPVFQGASTGHGRLPKGNEPATMAIVLEAFGDAARTLLADPAFAAAIASF